MNILIAGNGKVGSLLARQLSSEGHNITVIDSNAKLLQATVERYDVIGVHGNCASMTVLQSAGIREANLLIAATNQDEVNLLCCTTAHALNEKLHTIARIRDPEYIEQIYRMRSIFGLSMVINPENQAATEIDRLLKYPGFLRRDTFAKGRTEIVELRVDASSKLNNVRLMDLRSIVRCQVLVCTVLRDGAAIAPKGDFVLKEGDRVFFTALSQNLTTLLKNLGILTRRVRSVVLCGGGRISYYLAKRLEKAGICTKIIEKDYARCQELCELLPGVDVIHGDISEQDLLESEHVAESDALVTLTGLDELNMVVSLYASSRNLPQVITKISHTGNRGVWAASSTPENWCAAILSVTFGLWKTRRARQSPFTPLPTGRQRQWSFWWRRIPAISANLCGKSSLSPMCWWYPSPMGRRRRFPTANPTLKWEIRWWSSPTAER